MSISRVPGRKSGSDDLGVPIDGRWKSATGERLLSRALSHIRESAGDRGAGEFPVPWKGHREWKMRRWGAGA